MCYSEEQIKRYLEILHNYTIPPEEKSSEASRKNKCWNCQRDDCFITYSGFKVCENCGGQNGHVLGYFDNKCYDRLHFRKKSIYQRKYHYEKKVDQVCKTLQLTEDEKYDLYNKLIAIDNNVMEILNKQFCRKRMISIFYLIKKILEEMGNEKYKLVYINISEQTLAYYEKWWYSYKSLNNPLVKTPVNNPVRKPSTSNSLNGVLTV